MRLSRIQTKKIVENGNKDYAEFQSTQNPIRTAVYTGKQSFFLMFTTVLKPK